MDKMMGVYTIFDKVAEDAGPIFTAKNDAVAARAARHALRDADVRDFDLVKIGEYDAVKVRLYPCERVSVQMSSEKGDSDAGNV